MKEPSNDHRFRKVLLDAYDEEIETYNIEENWEFLRDNLLRATEQIYGWCQIPAKRKVTWWWNDTVDRAIKAKRQAWKDWKKGSSKENYQVARREARRQVYLARGAAERRKFANVLQREVFRVASQCVRENRDGVGEKCVRHDNGTLALTDTEKKEAWKCYHEKLLNEENAWEKESLPHVDPTEGLAILVDSKTIKSN